MGVRVARVQDLSWMRYDQSAGHSPTSSFSFFGLWRAVSNSRLNWLRSLQMLSMDHSWTHLHCLAPLLMNERSRKRQMALKLNSFDLAGDRHEPVAEAAG